METHRYIRSRCPSTAQGNSLEIVASNSLKSWYMPKTQDSLSVGAQEGRGHVPQHGTPQNAVCYWKANMTTVMNDV